MDAFKKGISRTAALPTVPGTATTDADADADANVGPETAEQQRKGDRTAKLIVQHAEDRGGASAVIKAFIEHIGDWHVVWRAARWLRDAASKDVNVKNVCLSMGLDELVLAAMAKLPHKNIVPAQCLRLLGVLAFGNDLVRRRVGERGGIALVLSAMDSHSDDETLQQHGFSAITNLAHNSIDNRSRFIELNGVDVIVAIMNRHLSAMKVQRQACWAILTLAGSDEVSRVIIHGGGGQSVVAAMIEHRFDSGIQQFGAWAVSNLALAGDDVRRRLKKNGVLEVCRIAMETHPDDQEVVRQARNAVGVLGPGGVPRD
jgi:hypothetical protein